MSRQYVPDRGHVCHVHLGNTGGTRELDGPHYCIVLSSAPLHLAHSMCIVVPTTSKPHPEYGPFAVELPALPKLKKPGWALVHQVRSIDYRERGVTFADQLDMKKREHRAWLNDLVDRLFAMVDTNG